MTRRRRASTCGRPQPPSAAAVAPHLLAILYCRKIELLDKK
jgi:hypothetical protein